MKHILSPLLVFVLLVCMLSISALAAEVQTTPMYRLYNPNSGEHFYTGSLEEKNNLVTAGWNYEGIAWNAPTRSGAPVYRLYNPNSGDHHYTMSKEETDNLVSIGWKYEGVCWNSVAAGAPGAVPLYRLYNPNADCGSHHYTTSIEERDHLVSVGWILEGIGWFGATVSTVPPAEVKLTISKTSLSLEVGNNSTLTAEYNGTGTLTWKSSNTGVATVSNGKVTAVAAGTAKITVSDGTKSASCDVTVTAPKPALKTLEITTPSKTKINVGDTLQIEYNYSGDNSELNWKVTDTSVLTVNGSGKVTGVSAGTTFVKVSNGDISAKIAIIVEAKAVQTTDIKMSGFDAPFSDGVKKFAGDYVTFRAWTVPEDGNPEVKVTSSNSDVVSVSCSLDSANDNHIKLKFKSAGSATIKITSGDGAVSKSYTINVKSGYACNPGGGQLDPETWANCCTQVMVENGFQKNTSCGSYRVLTLSADELTFSRAKGLGEDLVHDWWGNGCRYCWISYEGTDENGNHVFYTRWG